MDKKIEEAREEFNAILDYIVQSAKCREIHEVGSCVRVRLLRLGRILLEVFVLAVGTGMMGKEPVLDGTVYRYLRDSTRKYLSVFGEITTGPQTRWRPGCGRYGGGVGRAERMDLVGRGETMK